MKHADWTIDHFKACPPTHAMRCGDLDEGRRQLAFIWPKTRFQDFAEFVHFTRRFESLLKFLPEERPQDLAVHFIPQPEYEFSARQILEANPETGELADHLEAIAPAADLQWIPRGHFNHWVCRSPWPRLELLAAGPGGYFFSVAALDVHAAPSEHPTDLRF